MAIAGSLAGMPAGLYPPASMTIWRNARRPIPFVFVTITTWGFTDRFAGEVDSLSVYVFDADGKYLRTFSDGGEALSKPGYRCLYRSPR